MMCYLVTVFLKALKEFPLDGSATFLSLVVEEFWSLIRKEQFYFMSA